MRIGGHASVVHEHVHGAEIARDVREELLDLLAIGDVAAADERTVSRALHRTADLRRFCLARPIRDGNVGAPVGEQLRDAAADAARAAGHDRDPSGQVEFRKHVRPPRAARWTRSPRRRRRC